VREVHRPDYRDRPGALSGIVQTAFISGLEGAQFYKQFRITIAIPHGHFPRSTQLLFRRRISALLLIIVMGRGSGCRDSWINIGRVCFGRSYQTVGMGGDTFLANVPRTKTWLLRMAVQHGRCGLDWFGKRQRRRAISLEGGREGDGKLRRRLFRQGRFRSPGTRRRCCLCGENGSTVGRARPRRSEVLRSRAAYLSDGRSPCFRAVKPAAR